MWMVFLGLGALILLAGAIWFLIVTFQEGILWGLGCLFIAPAELLFLVIFWDKSWRPFVIEVVGLALIGVGVLIGPPELLEAVYAGAGKKVDKPAAAVVVTEAPPPAPRAAVAVKPPPPDTRTQAQRMHDDCASDLGMLCNEARGQKAEQACLSANKSALTPACRKAVSGL